MSNDFGEELINSGTSYAASIKQVDRLACPEKVGIRYTSVVVSSWPRKGVNERCRPEKLT
jgi:hypothetical protein